MDADMTTAGTEILAGSFKKYREVELIPAPDTATSGGKISLAFAREGKAIEILIGDGEQLPSLDLAQAGFNVFSRSPKELIKLAEDYLRGKRFLIVSQERLDFDFLIKVYWSDGFAGLIMLMSSSVVQLKDQLPLSGVGQEDVDRLEKQHTDFLKAVLIDIEIEPKEDRVEGVDLSNGIELMRRQFYKLIVPAGSSERKALDAFMKMRESYGIFTKADGKFEARKQKWWFPFVNMFTKERQNWYKLGQEAVSSMERFEAAEKALNEAAAV